MWQLTKRIGIWEKSHIPGSKLTMTATKKKKKTPAGNHHSSSTVHSAHVWLPEDADAFRKQKGLIIACSFFESFSS